jgi:hypothetical protein
LDLLLLVVCARFFLFVALFSLCSAMSKPCLSNTFFLFLRSISACFSNLLIFHVRDHKSRTFSRSFHKLSPSSSMTSFFLACSNYSNQLVTKKLGLYHKRINMANIDRSLDDLISSRSSNPRGRRGVNKQRSSSAGRKEQNRSWNNRRNYLRVRNNSILFKKVERI